MNKKKDLLNWVMLFIISIGVTAYLVVLANIVEKEQESILSASVGSVNQIVNENQIINKVNGEINKTMDIAIMNTNFGMIELKLYAKDAPKTVENFSKLIQSGFYDGLRFHRIIRGFMIQGGDPLSKNISMQTEWGTGGPGYQFADEINTSSSIYKTGYKRGILAMANSGPNTNGSQFFIMHQDNSLPPLYTIFGEVVSGLDVVDKIANNPTGAGDRPIKEVVIEKLEIR